MHPWLTTGIWGSHKDPGKLGHWGRGVGSPILPAGLKSSPLGLPHRVPRHTYVPHTVTNREHISHWSPDGHSTKDHQAKGSHPLAFPLHKAHHGGTLCWDQMATQLAWMQHGIGQIWGWTCIMPQRATPMKVKGGDPLEGWLKDAHQEAFGKDSNLVKQIRCTYFRAHCPEFNNTTTMTWPTFLGKWWTWSVLWMLRYIQFRIYGQARWSSGQPITQL